MQKNSILLFLLVTMITFFGCIEIQEEKFTPQYACEGDDIWLQVNLTRKASSFTVLDARGEQLFVDLRKRSFEYTVENISKDQLPLKVSLHKERDLWWDWERTIVPPIELFPASEWSSGIETVKLEVKKEVSFVSYEKEGEDCQCINYDEKNKECLEEKCEPYVDCISNYTFIYTPEKITWALPDWNYSSRIKVGGIKNTSPYPVSVKILSSVFELSPGSEYMFDQTSIRDIEIVANIPPELQISRECGTLERCCEGEKCHGYGELTKDDYPDPLECFEDLKTSVQLLLVCAGQEAI
ncbi:MAG: hypothetical protein KDE26_26110 [Bacteroidetes bacterium]|nr:hypothetical protein [Bacteroidota bacterium]